MFKVKDKQDGETLHKRRIDAVSHIYSLLQGRYKRHGSLKVKSYGNKTEYIRKGNVNFGIINILLIEEK